MRIKRIASIILISGALIMQSACAKQSAKATKLDPYNLPDTVSVYNMDVDKIEPNLTRNQCCKLFKITHEAYVDAEDELDACELDRKNLVKEADDFYYQDY